MLDRVSLRHDLIDCRGETLATKGFVLSPQSIAEAAGAAVLGPRVALCDTPHAAEVAGPLADPTYKHLFGDAAVRQVVERALLDIRLPDIDGFEVTRRLTHEGSDATVVLVSSRDAADFGGQLASCGAQGFIAKADLSATALEAVLAGDSGSAPS